MEFYLVKSKKLRFLGNAQDGIYENWITRESEVIAKLTPVLTNYATEALAERLNTNLFKPKNNDKVGWELSLKIEIPVVLSNEDAYEEDIMKNVSTKIDAYGENNFLYRIGNMFGNHNRIPTASLKVFVDDFGPIREVSKANGDVMYIETSKWTSKEERFHIWEDAQTYPTFVEESHRFQAWWESLWRHNFKHDMITAWKNGEEFQGTFTILLVLSNYALTTLILPEQPYFSTFRNMLKNKIEIDMKLVACNGLMVKCHRAMLAASSEKLADLLKGEPVKRVGVMDHLTHTCIEALLDYIYCRDIKQAVGNAEIGLQVLEAAIEFGLTDLVEVIRMVLLVRPNQWYRVDEAVDLFLLSGTQTQGSMEEDSNVSENDGVDMAQLDGSDDGRNDSTSEDTNWSRDEHDWEPLKKRAVEVLKWYSKNKYADLMASSKYRQLFRETPQIAMEVGKLFLQLG